MLSCHICRGSELLQLIDFGNHPVSKHYLDSPSADSPTWPVRLYFCESCGLTQLQDSCPPEILYANYVTLSSWKPQPHAAGQIERIKGLDGMKGDSKIIEIGCNDGEFMEALAAEGFSSIVGVEPSQDAYELAVAKGLNIVPKFLTPEVAKEIVREHGQFDLLVSRQNMEHMAELAGVLDCIRALVKPGGYVLIELPNFDCNLRWRDYSLWEEHVNYFTIDTLRHYLALADVEVIHDEIIRFSGEGIVVFGRRGDVKAPSLDYLPVLRARNVAYAETWPRFRRKLSDFLASEKSVGKKIAVYGAGSRAFCLINFAGLAPSLEMILDDQLQKQGHFMPGGRLPIVPGESLYSESIDLCLLAVNAENEEKVITKHSEWVSGGGRFVSVFPPSERLLPLWQEFRE